MVRCVPTLTFLGAAGTVTGSKFLLEFDGHRVLVDCGLFQGLKHLRRRNWQPLPGHVADLDAVVLSHGHLDHCGHLPRLYRQGFRGPVHASPGTIDLAGIVLPDSGHLQEEQATHANRHGWSRHDPALALYTEQDARNALELFVPLPHNVRREVAPGIVVELARAGHILGSSIVRVQLGGTSVTFSGDLGRPTHPLLRAPEPVGDTDWLVVESTYGDRTHDDAGAVEALRDVITRTIDRGGTVVIPAFAVDRTEVLLHHLGRLHDRGELPDAPIYVDSPMALAALRVYRDAIAARSEEFRPSVLADPTPFLDERVTEVLDPEGSKAITRSREPKVVVSASGMATGGRVVHHLAAFLPDPASSVVLVGFQPQGTRGRSLLDGSTELKMMGRYVRVRAEVVDVAAFSVHADADELMDWVATSSRAPRGVFVVHGEADAATALHDRIEEELDWTAVVARDDERVLLG
ncbi:MBL fold metallo-hydrolase RNA specificity domain-containing protein [Salsipaludibacter albus]|uniref:MBL fold metallo-hydrolase RNA specificity domain-containing protein n=1 Tax=Salsipaludibacter albus TaxID=2849650 RepID=UPI001EE42715|nr:MBL fold metallo-hydrolase [Salsipaludibacter albus]MBY5162030.1 MBL fold metallo-hydrolase [Salsipaludibacter albus]